MSVNSIGRFNNSVEIPEQQEPQEIKQQYNRHLLDEPIKDTVSFQGNEYGENNKSSGFGKIFGLTLLVGGLIVGAGCLGRAMKNGKCLENINKDSWYGKAITWVTDKCYSWCKSIKKFGMESWDKVKNVFNKKGGESAGNSGDKEKWYNKTCTKIKDACSTAYESVKKFGKESWDKIKNIFKKNGNK